MSGWVGASRVRQAKPSSLKLPPLILARQTLTWVYILLIIYSPQVFYALAVSKKLGWKKFSILGHSLGTYLIKSLPCHAMPCCVMSFHSPTTALHSPARLPPARPSPHPHD